MAHGVDMYCFKITGKQDSDHFVYAILSVMMADCCLCLQWRQLKGTVQVQV